MMLSQLKNGDKFVFPDGEDNEIYIVSKTLLSVSAICANGKIMRMLPSTRVVKVNLDGSFETWH